MCFHLLVPNGQNEDSTLLPSLCFLPQSSSRIVQLWILSNLSSSLLPVSASDTLKTFYALRHISAAGEETCRRLSCLGCRANLPSGLAIRNPSPFEPESTSSSCRPFILPASSDGSTRRGISSEKGPRSQSVSPPCTM